MRITLLMLALSLATVAPAGATPVANRPGVEDTSLVQADGIRILRESIVIAAPRSEVWKAFATTEGLKSWEAPVAAIDLRIGGYLEASYDAKAHLGDPNNIKHEVLGFLPGELLVFRNVQAPHGFKHADLFSHITTILQFEDAGNGSTRLIESGVGYGQGQDFDELYNFFHAGNAYMFEVLKARFEGGPGPDGDPHTPAQAAAH